MSKKILIIEDDKNLAESLKNIFVEKDLHVTISSSAQQAEQLISLAHYDLLIVDVILPKMNGISFLRQIVSKSLLPVSCKVWVMSGVLGKDVIHRDVIPHIDEFLKKPINAQMIKKKIKSTFKLSLNVLENIKFFYLNTWEKNKKNFLEDNEYIIQGHELMFIYFYLCSIRFTGVLHISYSELKKKDTVLFLNGNISAVNLVDQESYLGVLLVKNFLITEEKLQKVLKEKQDGSLGEYLVSKCYLSPHQLHKILREQMTIRLFKAMDHNLTIVRCEHFIPSQVFNQTTQLEEKHLLSLVDNWIRSKVQVEWLEVFFQNLKAVYIKPTNQPNSKKALLLRRAGFKFLDTLETSQRIDDLLKEKNAQDIMFEMYYRLLIKKNYLDIKTVSIENYGFLQEKYKNFLKKSKTKNYFELLNLPLNASQDKIELVYRKFAKVFHPDRIGPNAPKEMMEVSSQCFVLITKIYHILSDPTKKKEYLKSLDKNAYFDEVVIRKLYEQGKKNIEQTKYDKALDNFKSIINCRSVPNKAVLYYIWAIIKNKDGKEITKLEKEEILKLFSRVSMECSKTALFYFVQGLFLKVKGEKKLAFDYFKKAFQLDASFQEAQLELYSLSVKNKKRLLMNLFKKAN